MIRIGQGYDSHPYVEGQPFYLGGVRLPTSFGPKGHSDGDPLLHAIIDALLGAIGSGDIGTHFPPEDPGLAGISSVQMLRFTLHEVEKAGYTIVNLDTTILAERPKFLDHKLRIRDNIAMLLGLEPRSVAVKAKTNEKMGFIGRGEGIAILATVLLQQKTEAKP